MGGVKAVTGVTKSTYSTRLVTSAPKRGQVVTVDVPTYVTGTMEFENGAVGTIFTTFDVHYPAQARLEIYGTQGTLFVPDPNYFGGPISLYTPEDKDVKEFPLLYDYKENSRGLGLADMANALLNGRAARADFRQTLHVLEILTAFEKSSDVQGRVELETQFKRCMSMKRSGMPGVID